MPTTTMNISLTPELAAFIQAKVDSGMYSNASEVVRDALRSKQQYADFMYEIKLERLKATLAPGIEALHSKNPQVFTIEEVMQEIENDHG